MFRNVLIAIFFIVPLNHTAFSQVFVRPNSGLKSHETLEITKIETNSKSTNIYLTIENRIPSGEFCADKNIYIIYPDGKKSRLRYSEGIPECPASYKFKAIGEKLSFVLTFPALKENSKWIDLVEDCKKNCFSFYGIILNDDLNKSIDAAFSLGDQGKLKESLEGFIKIAEGLSGNDLGIAGLVYINIIKLEKELKNELKAEEWYEKFKLSGSPRLSLYLRYLEDMGIKY